MVVIDFNKLLDLQDCDRRLRQQNRECTDIPARKEDIQSRLNSHKIALARAEEALKKNALKVKELEGEVSGQNQKISKYRDQQLKVKNNDEYRALENEIKMSEDKIRELEDAEIDVMEEMEELKSIVETRQKELKEEESTVEEDLATMDERLKRLEEDIKSLEANRETLKEGIETRMLERYERILKHVGDFAIVSVNGGTCEGCHMQIPPQLVHDSRKKDILTLCSYCGRILYSGV